MMLSVELPWLVYPHVCQSRQAGSGWNPLPVYPHPVPGCRTHWPQAEGTPTASSSRNAGKHGMLLMAWWGQCSSAPGYDITVWGPDSSNVGEPWWARRRSRESSLIKMSGFPSTVHWYNNVRRIPKTSDVGQSRPRHGFNKTMFLIGCHKHGCIQSSFGWGREKTNEQTIFVFNWLKTNIHNANV